MVDFKVDCLQCCEAAPFLTQLRLGGTAFSAAPVQVKEITQLIFPYKYHFFRRKQLVRG